MALMLNELEIDLLPIVSGLSPPAFNRAPVSKSDHGSVEVLDRGRIQLLSGVVDVLLRLNQVCQGGINHIGVGRVIGRSGRNDLFSLFE